MKDLHLRRVAATAASQALKEELLKALIKYLEADHSGLDDKLVLMYAVNAISLALAEFVYPVSSSHILEVLSAIYPKQAKYVEATFGAPRN